MARRPTHAEAFLGESRRVQVTFTVSDVATAPASAPNYRQIKPDGTDTTVATGWTNPSTGVYYRDVDLDATGTWKVLASTAGLSSHWAAAYGEITVYDPMGT